MNDGVHSQSTGSRPEGSVTDGSVIRAYVHVHIHTHIHVHLCVYIHVHTYIAKFIAAQLFVSLPARFHLLMCQSIPYGMNYSGYSSNAAS